MLAHCHLTTVEYTKTLLLVLTFLKYIYTFTRDFNTGDLPLFTSTRDFNSGDLNLCTFTKDFNIGDMTLNSFTADFNIGDLRLWAVLPFTSNITDKCSRKILTLHYYSKIKLFTMPRSQIYLFFQQILSFCVCVPYS